MGCTIKHTMWVNKHTGHGVHCSKDIRFSTYNEVYLANIDSLTHMKDPLIILLQPFV